LLKKEGLVHRRRKRRPAAAPGSEPLSHAVQANDVWSIDYKGWFETGDGQRCDPLTITDNASRYLIRLTAMPAIKQERVRGVMEAAFRENGLPGAIRSDNGSPFVTPAPGGLSQLSIWWIKLGIRHERIEPGKPQQNGRHERFHWSLLKDRLDWEVAWDWRLQQGVFVAYRKEFNEERPHEALGMKTPAEVYEASGRVYRGRAPEVDYDGRFEVRRVNEGGMFLWKGQRVALSSVLKGERIGLLESDDEVYEVYFGPVLLGWFDGASGCFVRQEQAERLKEE
jgi:putative transposase